MKKFEIKYRLISEHTLIIEAVSEEVALENAGHIADGNKELEDLVCINHSEKVFFEKKRNPFKINQIK